jgi:hypothetical protein
MIEFLPEDKESLLKLESIPGISAIEETLAAAFDEGK